MSSGARWLSHASSISSTGVVRVSCVRRMRFDQHSPRPSSSETREAASSSVSATTSCIPAQVRYRRLPASMYPKEVRPDFTPFPLPKYDASLGFGPVRLHNVPDIEDARTRMERAPARQSSGSLGVSQVMEADHADEETASALWAALSDNADGVPSHRSLPHSDSLDTDDDQLRVPDPPADEARKDLGGYHVSRHFPLLDILECDRSVESLLEQFRDRPQREARTATVLDIAATLQNRSSADLARILYELSSLFEWDGNGLRFIAAKVVKFGRSYTVSSELTKAFMHLVEAMTVTFVEQQSHRLMESPALMTRVLHFLALLKVMEPNKWYTLTPNAPQNRADYVHPVGVNRACGYVTTGRVLVDYMEDVVTSGLEQEDGEDSTERLGASQPWRPHPFMEKWSVDDLLDVLCGFSGIMPDGKAPSRVVVAILEELWKRWSAQEFVLSEASQAAQLERLYMILQIMNVERDAVLDALLGGKLKAYDALDSKRLSSSLLFRERDDTPPLTLAPALNRTRGPNFFSAVSRDRRPLVQKIALTLLSASLATARADRDDVQVQALIESGNELLQSLSSKSSAIAFALREKFDTAMLSAIPHLAEVAERLQTPEAFANREYPLRAIAAGDLPDTNALLTALRAHPAPYLSHFKGRRMHPVRTFLTSLDYVASMDNVFLLHSSGVAMSVSGLIAVARRLRSGKDVLIVTASCLRGLQVAAQHSARDKKKICADRALSIVAYELEAGRAVIVPLSEELYLHDAGTYCDEDLMLWTIAAYLARDLPLVKVHTLMSSLSAARNPHHTLRGEHSPLTSRCDLNNATVPLLQAMRSKALRAATHQPLVHRRVLDRPQTLYRTNPIRSRFVYRRDKALFDKYHVTARHLAPGFSRGALDSDLRGLGFYTPDHPQVPYSPVLQQKCRPLAQQGGFTHSVDH